MDERGWFMRDPFPTHTLPEPVRSYITDGARAIGCDPSYIALPVLSSLASAIGNARNIQLKRTWNEPAILWTAIIGESGTAKSPALQLALRPIRSIQARHMQENAEALKAWEREHEQWERAPKGKGRPSEPLRPLCERVCTDDATIEAIAVLLQQNPRGLLMIRDELSGWFDFGRYSSSGRSGAGGADVAKWLEMFSGSTLSIDRKTSDPIYVPRASMSITGGVQPEIFKRVLGQQHRENGLAARFLFAWPLRKAKHWSEHDVIADLEAEVIALYDRLHAMQPETDTSGNIEPFSLVLTMEAKEAWIDFSNRHAHEQSDLTGDLAEIGRASCRERV